MKTKSKWNNVNPWRPGWEWRYLWTNREQGGGGLTLLVASLRQTSKSRGKWGHKKAKCFHIFSLLDIVPQVNLNSVLQVILVTQTDSNPRTNCFPPGANPSISVKLEKYNSSKTTQWWNYRCNALQCSNFRSQPALEQIAFKILIKIKCQNDWQQNFLCRKKYVKYTYPNKSG